jgi:ribonucleoside-diphosphate reductase alpha chain
MDYFHGDEMAATTCMNKYARKPTVNSRMTPEDAPAYGPQFARVESKYRKKRRQPNGKRLLQKKRKPLKEGDIVGMLHRSRYIVPQEASWHR